MLELHSVSYAYPACVSDGDSPQALDAVDLALAPGERVALLGPNGSGKSTLLRIATLQLAPSAGAVSVDGRVVAAGRRAPDDLRCRVGYVGQDPDDQMVAPTVFEEVAFGPCNLGLPLERIRGIAEGALGRCGLGGMEKCAVAALSGGQRQRLSLAGMVAMDPAYLVLDEPCSMLDPTSRREVLGLINEMASEGRAVLHATHDLLEVLDYDKALVMARGRVVWEGRPLDLLADDRALAMAQCLASPWLRRVAPLVRAGELTASDPFWAPERCASALRDAIGEKRVFDGRLPDGPAGGVGRLFGQEPVRLVFDGVSFAYGDASDRLAIRDVTTSFDPGSLTLVVGRPGSGKSTFLRLACGLRVPWRGSVSLGGRPVACGEIGCAFQRPEDQLFGTTVVEDVMFAPLNLGVSRSEARERAVRSCELVGLPRGLLDESPFALSGGQMRRAALAGVLSLDAPFMLFDEPLAGLDAAGLRDFLAVLEDLRDAGRGVVVVTHDAMRLVPYADRVVVLDEGSAAWDGCPSAFLADSEALRRAGMGRQLDAVLARALAGEGR